MSPSDGNILRRNDKQYSRAFLRPHLRVIRVAVRVQEIARPESSPESVQGSRQHVALFAAAVVVRPLDGGSPGFAANDRKPMNPASTMKLVTTYAALDLLDGTVLAHSKQILGWVEQQA